MGRISDPPGKTYHTQERQRLCQFTDSVEVFILIRSHWHLCGSYKNFIIASYTFNHEISKSLFSPIKNPQRMVVASSYWHRI